MVRAIDRGVRAQEYAEDSPIFSSLPNDICTLVGNAPGMAAWLGSTPSDGQAPRRENRVLCSWPATLTPTRAEVNIEISWYDRPAVANARLAFDRLLRENTCENMAVTTCERYRKDRKFVSVKHGDRACAYAANLHSVNYTGIMRKANLIVMVDVQTRTAVKPAKLPGLIAVPDNPVSAAFAGVDNAFILPPSPPDSDKIFPQAEPLNKCKPATS